MFMKFNKKRKSFM